MRLFRLCVFVLLGATMAAPAAAQTSSSQTGRAREAPRDVDQSPDFLFGRPRGSVGVRGNLLFARAGSDWFTFVTDRLTLDQKDFNAPGLATDVSIGLSPRLDAVVGVGFNQSRHDSEYRDFVDNNRLPITQNTRLRTTDLTGSVKFALLDRGIEVGRLAWVPRGVVPYVGAGGGAIWYKLDQVGDFIDVRDNSVFTSTLASSGWAPVAQAFAGVDVRVVKRVYVTIDGRSQWSSGSLHDDWVGFEPIDLAGFKLAAGANFLF